MKSPAPILTRIVAALFLAGSLSGTAFAHDGAWGYSAGARGHGDGNRYSQDHRPHYRPEYRQEHRHRRDRDGDWVGPAIALGIVGLALGAAFSEPERAAPAYAPPRYAPPPAYVPAPPPAPAAARYYCASAGLFYPDTAYCPEGWQLARPSGW